jgi:hypothetical protein
MNTAINILAVNETAWSFVCLTKDQDPDVYDVNAAFCLFTRLLLFTGSCECFRFHPSQHKRPITAVSNNVNSHYKYDDIS